MDQLKEIVSYFFAAMGMFSLLCAVYESMNQRLGSAGVLAGLFVASAFLVYLPQLETFKAFGIEARMQKNLIEAKEILEKVRQASIARILLGLTVWAACRPARSKGLSILSMSNFAPSGSKTRSGKQS